MTTKNNLYLRSTGIRLDRWLCAARFYKSRRTAKQNIEAGKVRIDGARVKVSREVQIGLVVEVAQGWEKKTIIVEGLSEQRQSATDAAKLYRETEASFLQRQARARQRKMARGTGLLGMQKPNKKERRQIHRFIRKGQDER